MSENLKYYPTSFNANFCSNLSLALDTAELSRRCAIIFDLTRRIYTRSAAKILHILIFWSRYFFLRNSAEELSLWNIQKCVNTIDSVLQLPWAVWPGTFLLGGLKVRTHSYPSEDGQHMYLCEVSYCTNLKINHINIWLFSLFFPLFWKGEDRNS